MTRPKREKFIELANKRVNKAINAVRLVGNLSNKSNYDYTSDDIKKIFKEKTKRQKKRLGIQ